MIRVGKIPRRRNMYFKKYPTKSLVMIVLIVGLFVAVLFSGYYEWRISADEAIGPFIVGEHDRIHITYPRYLILGKPNKSQYITIELVSSTGWQDDTAENSEYAVALSAPPQVSLRYLSRDATAGELLLTRNLSRISIVIAPVERDGIPKIIRIPVKITGTKITDNALTPIRYVTEVDIQPEVRSSSAWYSILLSILERADTLAVALAILIWLTDEQRRNELQWTRRKELLESLQNMPLGTEEQIIDAFEHSVRIYELLEKEKWPPELRDQYFTLSRQLFKQTQGWRHVIAGIGRIALDNKQGKISAAKTLMRLQKLSTDVVGDKRWHAKCPDVQNILIDSDEDSTSVSTSLDCLMLLHDLYSVDARDLVVAALEDIISKKESREQLVRIMGDNPELRSVLRHPRLIGNLPSRQLQELSSYHYAWPPFILSNHQAKPVEKAGLARWLEKAGLQQHPFSGANHLLSDELLAKTWADPSGWQSIEAPGNVLVYGQNPVDLYACALHLLGQLRPAEDSPTPTSHFPVWTFIDLAPKAEPQSILTSITRGCGDAWRDILACYPTAFQELGTLEQEMLAELLVWCAGSRQVLFTWLRKADAQRTIGEQVHLEWLYNRLEELPPEHPVSGVPNDRILLDWLRLRPPGYGRTLLIAAASPEVEIGYSELKWLIHRRFELDAQGIDLKIFVNLGVTDVGKIGIDTVPLSWTSETLAYIINQRITFASNGKIGDFSGLFDRSPRKAEQEIAEVAQGSLHRALQLADQVIQRHVASDPTRKNIRFNILDDVLREECG